VADVTRAARAGYGVRAAHEAGTEPARLRAVGVLDDLALMARETGQLDTARRLINLALDRVPNDPHRFNAVRASLRAHLARMTSGMGAARSSEADRYVLMSFDLHRKAEDDEPTPWLADYFPYNCASDSYVASDAAAAYHALAREDARFTGRAQQHARQALAHRGDGLARAKVFDQVMLARVRLRAGLLDQARDDGQQAIQMATAVSGSQRVRTRLAQLLDDTTPHQREPTVRELREELRATVS
jgi:hypothetical protein